ncbi:MAG: hypothetical protein JNL81_15675 [Hyphomonadaceae bacterium]|nr:hypothetical protein [Hyphomonadaceae bacterium]
MFFAQSLGPAINRRARAAIYEHVAHKLAGRGEATTAELRTIVTEVLNARGIQISADAAIQYLTIDGRLAKQDSTSFRLAA